MTCNFCKNGNMEWCLTSCYSDTFKCKSCGAIVEIKQNKYSLNKFQTVWNNQTK